MASAVENVLHFPQDYENVNNEFQNLGEIDVKSVRLTEMSGL